MRQTGARTASERLRRLLLVRAAETEPPRDGRLLGHDARPLSEAGRARVRALRRRWEWADGVVSSTLRRAFESARILAQGRAVRLDPGLRAMDCGIWHGLRDDEIRALDATRHADWRAGRDVQIPRGESVGAFHARVDAAFDALCAGPQRSLLVVSHEDVCRRIVLRACGRALPEGRPGIGERVLLTRDADGSWRLGRRSSDPAPLRSALEREGLGGAEGGEMPPQHVGSLELRARRFPA